MESINSSKQPNLRRLCHPGEDKHRAKAAAEQLNLSTDATPLRATQSRQLKQQVIQRDRPIKQRPDVHLFRYNFCNV